MKIEKVYNDILEERRHQARTYGQLHDDQQPTVVFCDMIVDYVGWARQMARARRIQHARDRLVQVAALAVAAIESIDRTTIELLPTREERIDALQIWLSDPDIYRMGEKEVTRMQRELELLKEGRGVKEASDMASGKGAAQ